MALCPRWPQAVAARQDLNVMNTGFTNSPPERPGPDYAVVVVAYRSRPLLSRMLAKMPESAPVIVVDNSADYDDLTDLIRARPKTTYIDSGGNIGFGPACNLAASVVAEPLIAFVNPDADVDGRLLGILAREIDRDPRCSSCGPILVDDEGHARSGSGGWLPTPWRALIHATGLFRFFPRSGIGVGSIDDSRVEVEWIAGTCLMIRRTTFLELGGFAPQYFLYQEDMDLGRRLQERRYRQILRGDLRVRHVAGTSTELQDVRHLAWRRASALVDYVTATHRRQTARLICAVLASGMLLRALYALLRFRPARLEEFLIHARTLGFPDRTLTRLRVEQQARRTVTPAMSEPLMRSHRG